MARHILEAARETPAGPVPRVRTSLSPADRLGSWRARWGWGRMHYHVEPGLYAAGAPGPETPVFVTANYKMSFDRLRVALAGRDGWILVLDTKGINVWCAAGKGTFGTDEIVRRVAEVRLDAIVSHRKLVVPQLGAPGVAAHEVKRRSGFRVVYGPVRAGDLPAFLDAGMKATPGMRRVRFSFRDRLVLVPIEVVGSAKYLLAAAVLLALVGGLEGRGYALGRAAAAAPAGVLPLLAGYLAGAVLTPLLLPWLPGNAFALKGVWAGALLALVLALSGALPFGAGQVAAVGSLLLLLGVASFLGMNFTGASTYTSLSGVRREMRFALPAQGGAVAAGLVLSIAARLS